MLTAMLPTFVAGCPQRMVFSDITHRMPLKGNYGISTMVNIFVGCGAFSGGVLSIVAVVIAALFSVGLLVVRIALVALKASILQTMGRKSLTMLG